MSKAERTLNQKLKTLDPSTSRLALFLYAYCAQLQRIILCQEWAGVLRAVADAIEVDYGEKANVVDEDNPVVGEPERASVTSGAMTIAQAKTILQTIAARGPANETEQAAVVLVEYLETCVADIQARGGPEVMA